MRIMPRWRGPPPSSGSSARSLPTDYGPGRLSSSFPREALLAFRLPLLKSASDSVRQSRFSTGFHSRPSMGELEARGSDYLLPPGSPAFGWDSAGWGGPVRGNVLTNIRDEAPAFSCKALNSKKLTRAPNFSSRLARFHYGLPSHFWVLQTCPRSK